jgi:Ser/Thr protein kinase RdoA (MazF antagonist)
MDAMEGVFDALVRMEPDAWLAWRDVAPELGERILALDASPIPATLVHGDSHPGNAQVDGDEVRIFDWSDGAISHPFVDLAVYLRHLPTPAERRRMVDAYLEPWSGGYERAAIERAAADAVVVGAVYQVASYVALVPALDPRDRWQYEHGAPRWLRAALRPVEVAPAGVRLSA